MASKGRRFEGRLELKQTKVQLDPANPRFFLQRAQKIRLFAPQVN